MSKIIPKWQQEFLDSMSKMNNVELMDAVFDLAGGDDYDGCFTDHGMWEFEQLTTELDRRLAQAGFYTPEQYQSILDKQSEPYSEGYSDASLDTIKNKYDESTNPDAHRQYKLGWEDFLNQFKR